MGEERASSSGRGGWDSSQLLIPEVTPRTPCVEGFFWPFQLLAWDIFSESAPIDIKISPWSGRRPAAASYPTARASFHGRGSRARPRESRVGRRSHGRWRVQPRVRTVRFRRARSGSSRASPAGVGHRRGRRGWRPPSPRARRLRERQDQDPDVVRSSTASAGPGAFTHAMAGAFAGGVSCVAVAPWTPSRSACRCRWNPPPQPRTPTPENTEASSSAQPPSSAKRACADSGGTVPALFLWVPYTAVQFAALGEFRRRAAA